MKEFKMFCVCLFGLAVWFSVENITFRDAAKGLIDMGGDMLAVVAGRLNSSDSQPRRLPQGQGDDSESIKPIEELEDIE